MEDHADELAAKIGVTREVLYDRVARLAEQERLVLSLRFGLDGEGARTAEEVGNLLGVTSQRIGQIEELAILNLGDA